MTAILTPPDPLLDRPADPLPGIYGITDREFQAVRKLIYQEAGISLSDAKRVLVCSRLARRLRELGLRTHAEYLDYLESRDPDGTERQRMINCLTTNKTDFFREPHHFDFLRRIVFPKVQRRAAQGRPRRLRIWSAGCSLGDEPYSIAITILEHFPSLQGWDVRILASDVNTEVLHTAEQGIYPLERIAGLDKRLKGRYFQRGVGRWDGCCQVRPEARRLVTFRQINFMDEAWPIHTRFDAIFCRNVIIYFDVPTQSRLLPRFADQMVEDGYLLLGHSENLHWLSELFSPQGNTVYQRRSTPPANAPTVKIQVPPPPRRRLTPTTHRRRQEIVAGEFFASRQPVEISTVLGSCVAACLFDPVSQIGGMNHFMLPFDKLDSAIPGRYGVHAMELLINEIMKIGGDRRRLRAKAFGGANVLRFAESDRNVGRRNIDFVRQFLATEGIPIVAECLGGESAMRVHFASDTAKAYVKPLRSLENIAEREQRYRLQVDCELRHPPPGTVTLF